MTDAPQWYLDVALARLARIEELTPLCAWEKRETELTPEERAARKEWRSLMRKQARDEEAAGL